MDNFITALKDILIVITPIVVAFISYRSNKKSKNEIRQEVEKSLKEKDAETSQILQKISAELESQKQLAVWNNSLPMTNDYTQLAGKERYGNISALSGMIESVYKSLEDKNYTADDLLELKAMLKRINLPNGDEPLYPYEIPILISYNKLVKYIDDLIE